MKQIMRCRPCRRYTLLTHCPICGARTETVHPPKYSPLDKWAAYRRKFKFDEAKKKG